MPKLQIFTKWRKENCMSISIFDYVNKGKFPIYVSNNTFQRHIDLLLIEEENQSHYVIIKDFNTFMNNETLHHDRKHCLLLLLQIFYYCKNIRNHVNDTLKLMSSR